MIGFLCDIWFHACIRLKKAFRHMTNYEKYCGKILALGTIMFMGMTTLALAQTTDNQPAPPTATTTGTANTTLTVYKAGDATYVTGGIGEAEQAALVAAKGDFNLHLLNATKDGAYVEDVTITLSRAGKQIINTKSGPIFYANLPSGKYVIEGSYAGNTQQKNITVAKGKPLKTSFAW
jgi:hypothetical protein